MPAKTLEQRAIDVDKILEGVKRVMERENPEEALKYMREAVSKAESDGRINRYSLVYLASETQKLVENYLSEKQKIENNEKKDYSFSGQIYPGGDLPTGNFPRKSIEN